MEHDIILKIIGSIRDSFPNAVTVYTKGSCIQFALILNNIYPEGDIYYNSDHAIFKYGNYYYDITGEVMFNTTYTKLIDYGIIHINELLKLRYNNGISSHT